MDHKPLRPFSPFAVIVNEDADQLQRLSELVRTAGLEPRGFTNAEAALIQMCSQEGASGNSPGALPALVVTDLCLPGIDGCRFCRLLRSSAYAAFNPIPILVTSSTFAVEEATRIAVDLGAEAFLSTPVAGHDFIEKLQRILDGWRIEPPLRVLIVEDERTLAGELHMAFTAAGYQASTARMARTAVQAFKKTAYDVAVLDDTLPDGSSDALLEVIRNGQPDCVCLMMTMDPAPERALEWVKHGAVACLVKPIQPGALVEQCARARRERALLHLLARQKQTELKLRESEAKHRILLEESSDPIFSFTPEGQYLYVNRAFANGVGKPLEDIIGKRIWDVFPIEEADKRFQVLSGVFRTGEEKVIEVRVPRADGDRHYVTTITPIKESGGKVVSVICSSKDITDRKRAEQELLREQQLMKSLLESLPGIFYLYSYPELRLIRWNKNHETLLGFGAGEIKDRSILEWHLPELKEAVLQAVEMVMQEGQNMLEAPLLTKDGRLIPFLLTGVKLEIAEQSYLMGVGIDLTERKRAEEEKARLEGQLQQAQKMESVGRLAGGVAHDFNNMLGVILGHAEMAMLQIDPADPLHSDLQEILKAGRRSADLTRQLLAFARKQTVAPKVLDLNETVAGMLRMLQRLIGEDIHLNWWPKTDLWLVKVDPSQIDQILANLCVNSRDAITDVGNITIETGNCTFDEVYCHEHQGFLPGEYVRLGVSDDGCGMAPETLAHVFEPFFTTKGVGQGTGLGLATVYGAVRQNNGFITASSELNQGTSFSIYLPRYMEKALEHSEGGAAATQRGQETILLVEDEPTILKLTKRMLEAQGYKVLTAHTPGEGLRLARENAGDINLLITDVVMPEMNGRDLAKNLSSLYPKLKRLFMSGYTSDVIAHRGVLDEGIHFIEKPFSTKSLTTKVREVLESE
jgi:two-component system, cell cycle sensor histidine kinase and response regulator CckA